MNDVPHSQRMRARYLVEANSIADGILAVVSGEPSEYRSVKNRLAESRHLSRDNPKKLIRELRKAYGDALEESSIAYMYNRARETLDLDPGYANDPRLTALTKEYREALSSGHYVKARKLASAVAEMAERARPE